MVSVVYLLVFVSKTLFRVHSVGPGQAIKVLFPHFAQNSNSEPLDSQLNIRTIDYTTKHNNEEGMNERKKE